MKAFLKYLFNQPRWIIICAAIITHIPVVIHIERHLLFAYDPFKNFHRAIIPHEILTLLFTLPLALACSQFVRRLNQLTGELRTAVILIGILFLYLALFTQDDDGFVKNWTILFISTFAKWAGLLVLAIWLVKRDKPFISATATPPSTPGFSHHVSRKSNPGSDNSSHSGSRASDYNKYIIRHQFQTSETMKLDINPLRRLLDEARGVAENVPGIGPIRIEIPIALATDLMAMNAEGWKEGSNGSLDDNQIHNLLSGITMTGLRALNGLHIKGVIIFVTSDASLTGLRVK